MNGQSCSCLPDKSEALVNFEKRFAVIMEQLSAFHPDTGYLVVGNEAPLSSTYIGRMVVSEEEEIKEEGDKRQRVLQNILGSVVVNVMALFEGYVHDIFSEAFNYTFWDHEYKLCKDLGMDKNAARQACVKSWPVVTEVMHKLFSNFNKKEGENSSCEFYSIIRDEDVWLNLLTNHRDTSLRGLSEPTVEKMNVVLTKLFAFNETPKAKNPTNENKLVLEKMVEKPFFKSKWEVPVEKDSNAKTDECSSPVSINKSENTVATENVEIKKLDTLKHILNLMYAIRCVYVHGTAQRTIDGALKNISEKSFSELENTLVEAYLNAVDKDIRANKLKVDYRMCINICNFIETVAKRLQGALGSYIYDKFKLEETHKSQFQEHPKTNELWGLNSKTTDNETSAENSNGAGESAKTA